MTAPRYLSLVDGSDLIVHEATYLEGEIEKAHMYFHSEIQNVLQNFSQIDYRKILFSHISNRYDDDDIRRIKETLGNHATIAHDYLEITIPRISLYTGQQFPGILPDSCYNSPHARRGQDTRPPSVAFFYRKADGSVHTG